MVFQFGKGGARDRCGGCLPNSRLILEAGEYPALDAASEQPDHRGLLQSSRRARWAVFRAGVPDARKRSATISRRGGAVLDGREPKLYLPVAKTISDGSRHETPPNPRYTGHGASVRLARKSTGGLPELTFGVGKQVAAMDEYHCCSAT